MGVWGSRCLLAASVFFGLSSASLAGEPASSNNQSASALSPVPGGTAEACVLHVWPAGDARSSYRGWFHGGAVDGDKRGIKGYPAMHSDVLTTAVQHQLLEKIDWSGLLATQNLSVVVHDRPPPSDDDQARIAPLTADRPDCYGELIVHSVLVERAVFSATTVRLMIIAKKWRGRTGQPSTFSVMSNEKVKLDSQDMETLETSMKNGFAASVAKTLSNQYFRSH